MNRFRAGEQMWWAVAATLCVWVSLATSTFAAAQAPQAQEPVQLEGDVEVFVEDYPAASTTRYFLNANGRRREMRFTANQAEPVRSDARADGPHLAT